MSKPCVWPSKRYGTNVEKRNYDVNAKKERANERRKLAKQWINRRKESCPTNPSQSEPDSDGHHHESDSPVSDSKVILPVHPQSMCEWKKYRDPNNDRIYFFNGYTREWFYDGIFASHNEAYRAKMTMQWRKAVGSSIGWEEAQLVIQWTKFYSPLTGRTWYSNKISGERFDAKYPYPWKRFFCAGSYLWWWNAFTEQFFYEPRHVIVFPGQ